MSLDEVKPCPCGSGKPSTWLIDARGIALKRTCADCHDKVKAKYRPEIFNDLSYWTDEPVGDKP